jgi:hypothetical protein
MSLRRNDSTQLVQVSKAVLIRSFVQSLLRIRAIRAKRCTFKAWETKNHDDGDSTQAIKSRCPSKKSDTFRTNLMNGRT